MTTKTTSKLDAYRKEVFQSPFTGAFFALDQSAAFEKHLREQTKNQKTRDNTASKRDARIHFWTALREQTSSVQDLEHRLAAIPEDILNYYKKKPAWTWQPIEKIQIDLDHDVFRARQALLWYAQHHPPQPDWAGVQLGRVGQNPCKQ